MPMGFLAQVECPVIAIHNRRPDAADEGTSQWPMRRVHPLSFRERS
jgi:hypothetical protein